MRHVFSTAAMGLALVLSAPFIAVGQNGGAGLTINKYTLVGEERLSRSEWYVTYRAELTNNGAARSGVTAVVTSLCPTVRVVPGQGIIHFGPVASNGSATSIDTFTLLVDRSILFNLSDLVWSFVNPVAHAGPNQTVARGATVNLNGSGSTNPNGGGTLTYRWTLQTRPSGSQATISNPTSVVSSFIVDVAGVYVVQLTVENGLGSDTASITVSTMNSPPVANAGPNQTVALNTTVTVSGNASSDVDGNPLTYSWSIINHPMDSICQLSASRSVNASFVVDRPGIYIAQLTVNDGTVDSAPATVTITTANTSPVANAGPNQTVAAGALVQLNGAGSTDVDGNALTYRWSLITTPSGSSAAISNTTAVNPTFTADKPGIYVAQLIVNDGKVDSSPATVAITTNAVQRPTAHAGMNQTVNHGVLVTLNGTYTDPQQLPCSLLWSLITRPTGSSAALSGATTGSPTFVADLPGTYVAQLLANNGAMASEPATVTITTTNTPPVANAGPNQNVFTAAVVGLDGGSSADADHDTITYSWSFASRPAGSTTAMQAPTSRTPNFFADVAGTYVAQLIVNDGFTNSNPSTVTITASSMAIGLSPNPLNLYNAPVVVTVTLSAPAPAGGTAISFGGFDPSVVSLSGGVLIPEGGTGANVSVTPVAPGSTNLTASALNYQPASVPVTVAEPRITLSSDLTGVGISRSIDASITLNAPAPPNGAVVTLSGTPGLVSFIPPTVSIPAGQTTGTFKIVGVAEGQAVISASSPGYSSGALNILVVIMGGIQLPANLTVGLGQTTGLDVRISMPAPVGGVTLDLASGNTSVLTVQPSVFIAAGATAPAAPPQVTGVALGSATISASAAGFTADSKTVKVGATLSFSTQAVTVGAGGVQSTNLLLSAPAPSGGLTINLSSSAPTVATVPPSVTIDAGSTNASVQITGVAAGPAVITAATSTPNITGATLNVTVSVSGAITTPPQPSVQLGQSAAFPITLTAPAPQSGLTITLSSAKPDVVTIAPLTVTIPAGQTQPSPQPQITGVGFGSAAITATAVGYSAATETATVHASLTLSPPSTTLNGSEAKTLTVTLSGPAPYDVVVNLSASPAGKVALPASVAITKNATAATVEMTGVASGTATITASAATAPNVTNGTATVTTQTAGALSLPSNVTVGLGQSAPLQVTLPSPAPAGGVSVNLSSSNPAKVTIAPSTVTIPGGETQPLTAPQVTGVDLGTADITAAANMYTSAVRAVQVTATISLSPLSLSLTTTETKNLTLTLSGPAPAGGMTFAVASSNVNAATCKSGTATIPAHATTASIAVSGVAVGSSVVRVSAPNLTDATADINVAPAVDIIMPATATVAPGDVAPLSIRLAREYPATVFLSLSTSDETKATVWPTSVTIAPGQTVPSTPVSITGVGSGNATITAQGNGIALNPASTAVTVGYRLTLSPPTVTILGNGNNGTLNLQLSGPAPVSGILFTLTSSNPGVVTLPSEILLPGMSSSIGVRLTSVSPGSAVIRVRATDVPEATANVTVVPPGALVLSGPASIGLNEEANLNVALSTPALAGGVLIEFATSDNKKVGLSQASVTIPAGSSAPAVAPKLIGVNTGSATITATATGYSAPAPLTVNVTAAVAWVTQNAVIAGTGKQAQLTLRLSTTAPAAGLTVNLSSSNPGVATVPPTGTFNWDGSTSPTILVPVTSVALGTTTIHASGTNVPDVTTTVTVVGPVSITTTELPSGVPGVPYNATVSASGGVPPYTWSATGLPSGLTIDPSSGAISGTASAAGSSTATITVNDSQSPAGTASKQLTVTIGSGLSITTVALPAGDVGTAYTATVAATGGATPYSWSATGLPAPLTINQTTGAISGTPTAPSSGPVTITVTDATNPTHLTASKQFTLTITSGPQITTTALPDGAAGTAYSSTVAATGGTTPYTWTATGLPATLVIDPATGAITGIPGAAGSATVNVTVTDAGNRSNSKQFPLTIRSGLTITTATLPYATVGAPYSATVGASGGVAPYTWAATGLPAGISIAPATGAITGTASSSGSSSVSITVTDASSPTHQTFTKQFTLSVGNGVSLTPQDSTILGNGKQVTLYLTLAAPAPEGGVEFTITSSNQSVATVPGSAFLSYGSTSVGIRVISVGPGSTVIRARATGFADATANVTVAPPGTVNVTGPATVSLSNTIPLNISLSAPAPAGGVTVTLSTSDPSKVSLVTTTVYIPADATTPSVQPQVKGENVGAASIIGRAPGYTDSAPFVVNVGATVAWEVPNVTIAGLGKQTLVTLRLSATAPMDGLTVNLTSSNPAVATVQPTAIFIWDGSSAPGSLVPVISVGSGTTTLHASGTNVPDVTMTVTVVGPLTITSTTLPNGVVGNPYNGAVAAAGGQTPYSWSATGLPAGLTIDSATGVISGTPTSAGPSAINVTVLDASSPTRQSASHLFNVAIAPGLAITTASLPSGVATSPYNAPLAATGGTPSYAWSASGLPSGLTINPTTGAISGTAAAAFSGTVTVTVSDATSPAPLSKSKEFPLTIAPPPSITTATLPGGVVNTPYSAALQATGGTTPYSWSATGLPAPLTINPTSGVISGTPIAASSTSVTVTVTDSTGTTHLTASKQFTLTIEPPCTWTPSLPGGFAGVAYSATLPPGCGTPPFTFSATGLPPTFAINPTSGAITGNPTAPSSTAVELRVCDSSNPPQCANRNVTLVIGAGLSITTASLSDGVVGVSYSATLNAAGGTPSYTWSAANLPAGLTINATTGVISGTPTAVGSSNVIVTVTDSTNPTHLTAPRQFTITIAAGMSITTAALAEGVASSPYSQALLAAGGVAPYTWAASGLPAGLTIDPASGTIAGTTTVAGSHGVSVTVTDSASPTHQSVSRDYILSIGPALSIVTPTLPAGVATRAYSATVAARGGTTPYAWSATNLPAGLTINPASGEISGTPAAAGSSTVTVTVTDATGTVHQSDTRNYTLTIAPLLSITTANLPDGVANSPYSRPLAATGGTTPYAWSATGLPSGLSIHPTTGVISGTPASAGTIGVDVTVTDAATPTPQTATARFNLTIRPALSVTTAQLPGGFAGHGYTFTMEAAGGTPSYTWAATGLPAGLTIATATGVISGNPTVIGSNNVNVTVTDSNQLTAVRQFTLSISAGPTITTASLPDGFTNLGYSITLGATGGTPGYSWSAAPLPAGLSINTVSGVISGTPTAVGTTLVHVVATDATAPTALTASKDLQLTVKPGVSIVTASPLPSGPAGSPYSATIAATGGNPPYTWSATNLPAGFAIAPSTGVISGNPTAPATTIITVSVADSTSPSALTASKPFTLTIGPALSIATTALSPGSVGSPYSFQLSAGGGTSPYTWAITGLPAGLTADPATGIISGSPTAASSGNVNISVTDSTSPQHQSVTVQLPLTITPKLVITTAALPSKPAGSPYSAPVAATGGTGPYTWSATGLPTGFTIDQATGLISGNPAAPSTNSVTVTVTDSTAPVHQTDSKQFPLTIGPALSISTASLPEGLVTRAYSSTVIAAGGTSPYTWSATGLPAGFAINATTGEISGTPAAAGTSTVNVTATDTTNPTHQSVTKQFSLVIRDLPQIATATLPPGITNTPYGPFTLAGTGGKAPYTWSSVDLPQRLEIGASTGIIGGTPMNSGVGTVHIKMSDSSNPPAEVTKAFTITIVPLLTLDTTTLPTGIAGMSYSMTPAASGGVPPLSWSAQGLPPNLTINASTGVISGAPVAAGSYPVTLTVTDALAPTHQSVSRTITLVIDAQGPFITVSDANIGLNLQTPITVTLSPPPVANVTLTITSDNPSVTLGSFDTNGSSQLTATVSANTTTVSTFAKALGSSGTARITASIAGYASGVGTVTLYRSGFVIGGPQGIGAQFTTYPTASSDLTIHAARLDASNGFAESQQIRGGYSVNVPVTVAPSISGSLNPVSVAFSSGMLNAPTRFTVATNAAGSGAVSVTSPAPFTTPAAGGSVPFVIEQSGILPGDPSLPIGKNLQAMSCMYLTNTALTAAVPITVTSSNPAKLKFSTSPTGVATESIVVTVPKNQKYTPYFYFHAYDSGGPVAYTATAPGYGLATSNVTLTESGFVIFTPYGPGANFTVALGSPNPTLSVYTARLASGSVAATQSVASGASVTIGVTSSNPSVGTVLTSPITIGAGESSASTQFHAVAGGSTTVRASSSGWSDGAVIATVEEPPIILPTATVGQYLQESGYIILPVAAPSGGLQVTLQSNSSLLKFSTNPLTAGTGTLVVTIPEGDNLAVVYLQSLGSSGPVTYSGSAPGYRSATVSVDLAPSGIVLAGPGMCAACTFPRSGGPQELTVYTALLEAGTNRPVAPQTLAGGASVSVNIGNSNRAAGETPGSAVIAPNTSAATVLFTPAEALSTTVSVTQPAGWTTPNSMTQVLISVQ